MITISRESAVKPGELRPMIKCLPLPAFETGDLNSVYEMFRLVPRQALGQTWLKKEEPDFAPGFIRTAWRGNSLLVFAELVDLDIFNDATGLNQRAWELGDTFEIFLRPTDDDPAYFEFQVTPNNQRLQLWFPNAGALDSLRKTGSIDGALVQGEAFYSRTWVQPDGKYWCVYAQLGAAELGGRAGSLQGRQWQFSFSRYDYTRGRKEPVISSTSPHAEPDFHRHQEWGVLKFETHP
jgi:hypothetical protein